MDTFPTPRFLGFWPEGVLVDSHYMTNFNLVSGCCGEDGDVMVLPPGQHQARPEEGGLRRGDRAPGHVGCLKSFTHCHHSTRYNPGSTWYGDGRRVRHLARLTVALNQVRVVQGEIDGRFRGD